MQQASCRSDLKHLANQNFIFPLKQFTSYKRLRNILLGHDKVTLRKKRPCLSVRSSENSCSDADAIGGSTKQQFALGLHDQQASSQLKIMISS